MFDLKSVQAALQQMGIDGWLLYDFRGLNVLARRVAGLGEGGRFGPDLSTVGSQLGLAQIEEAVREPKKEPENSIMPRYPLSGGQVAQLATFLKSRVRDPLYATPMQVQAGLVALPPLPAKTGEGILQRKKCLA